MLKYSDLMCTALEESILLNYFPEIRDMQTIQILEDTYLYKLVKEKTKYKSFITATNQK